MLLKRISILLFSSSIVLSSAVYSDTADENPYTLVYQGAIKENLPGRVNIHPVSYNLDGLKIAANVYTPPGYEKSKRYPAIVVAHPNGGVKAELPFRSLKFDILT